MHYSPTAAQSTLARSLLGTPILWPYLGITGLTVSEVAEWIRRNMDRENFYLPAGESEALKNLEWYLRGNLGPVFEGTRGEAS
jgi:hypothetical protein